MRDKNQLKQDVLAVIGTLHSIGKLDKFKTDPLSFFNILWNTFGDDCSISYHFAIIDEDVTLITYIDDLAFSYKGEVNFLEDEESINAMAESFKPTAEA